ncbi:MAG: hypothetical protein M3321_11515 [Actinomycetota bacterium]|nr:hypothetical protein [Actinomycetota bacterium]
MPQKGRLRAVRPADYKGTVYDALTSRYTFACPERGETRVTLSSFRVLEQLPGAAHPAVFRVRFACACGGEHVGLVAHDELDWAPLGLHEGLFLNLMTARLEALADELSDLAARRIQAGEWPWSFFCYPENRPRPIFPSSFVLLAPGGRSLGIAVRCPSCTRTSVNLVTHSHVDLPFHNDREIGVVQHVFADDALGTLEEFRTELYSASFDARRLTLE